MKASCNNLTAQHPAAHGWLLVAVLVLLASSGVCLAGSPADFANLEAKLEREMERYQEALRSMLEKNPRVDLSDPSNRPPDPRPAILQQMDAAALSQAKAPGGFDMQVAVLYWSLQLEDEKSPQRFATLAKTFPDMPDLADVLVDLDYASSSIRPADAWAPMVAALATRTKSDKVRQHADFLLARLQVVQGHNSEAIVSLKKLVRSPNKELADKAKGQLFQLEHLQIGMTLPEFSATSLNGKKVSLQSLRGKVVLVDFWATWCPSCVAEFPTIHKAIDRFKTDLVVLGLSADEHKEAILKFAKKRPIPGIQTWDMTDGRFPIFEQFNVVGLPTWFLLDAKGRISAVDPFGANLIPAIKKALKSQ